MTVHYFPGRESKTILCHHYIFFSKNELLFEMKIEECFTHNRLHANAHTSTGTVDVCMCAYCGIYAPCIGVLAAMNCTMKEKQIESYIEHVNHLYIFYSSMRHF